MGKMPMPLKMGFHRRSKVFGWHGDMPGIIIARLFSKITGWCRRWGLMEKIGFIGSGKMAGALISAILRGGLADKNHILCSDALPASLQETARKYGVRIAEHNRQVFQETDVVFLSFKPQNFPSAVEGLRDAVRPDHLIVSIMAGVRIGRIEQVLPGRIIRVMPNTACLVGRMAAGFARGPRVTDEQAQRIRKILDCAGVAVEVEENQLDAVTGLSGSGPAFVARLIEAFIAAGEKAGLSRDISRTLTLKTFEGTAHLLDRCSMQPEELINLVSSPNGTTVAGRAVLEASDFREIIEQTILRAAARSKELGA
jgi:pyrroline-5-carboxylate reductase